MADPIKKVFVKATISSEVNSPAQDTIKKKVMVKIPRAELEKQAQIKRDEIIRKKDSILNRNATAQGMSREQVRIRQESDKNKPDCKLDGLNIDSANKRSATKGSCSTGATMGGDSLKDTK